MLCKRRIYGQISLGITYSTLLSESPKSQWGIKGSEKFCSILFTFD